jgi:hypothetical protein
MAALLNRELGDWGYIQHAMQRGNEIPSPFWALFNVLAFYG